MDDGRIYYIQIFCKGPFDIRINDTLYLIGGSVIIYFSDFDAIEIHVFYNDRLIGFAVFTAKDIYVIVGLQALAEIISICFSARAVLREELMNNLDYSHVWYVVKYYLIISL